MDKNRSLINKQRGSASIVAIILIMLLLAICKSLFPLSQSENTIASNFRNGIAAQYLAEGGVRRAIFELSRDNSWHGVSEDIGTAPTNGHLVITVKPTNDVVWVTSSATINSSDRFNTVQRVVGFAYVWPPGRNNIVYDYAVFSGGKMTISPGVSIKKDSPGRAHAMAGSRSTIDNYGTIDNGWDQNRVDLQVPIIDRNSYEQGAPPPPTNAEIDNYCGLTGRIYCYTSSRGESYSITDYRNLPGNGVIYSKSAVFIGEGVKLPGRVIIISEASIIINKNARLNKALLVAGQNIEIADNVKLTGCIIAGDTLIVNNGTEIIYDPDINNMIQTNFWGN